jgi:hypothetical protein
MDILLGRKHVEIGETKLPKEMILSGVSSSEDPRLVAFQTILYVSCFYVTHLTEMPTKKNAKTMTIQDDVDPYGHQASYNQSLIVGEKQAYTKS